MKELGGALRGIILAAALVGAFGFDTGVAVAEDGAMASHDHAGGDEGNAGFSHHHDGDLLLFPDVTATHFNTAVPGARQNDVLPEVDIFYSTDHERLRFLAELLMNRDEREMERLQLGWLFQPTSTVWLGRFHNPLGFWNSEHHHGAYLQTTISRPSIVAFEDEGGVLPTHVSGLLAEGSVDRAQGSFNYAFGLGKGPGMEPQLEPMNIIEFRHGGKLAASARLSYRPFDDNAGEFGGFAGYTRIPITAGAFDEADQTVAGAFYMIQTAKLRVIGEWFFVANRLQGALSTENAGFRAGYLQAEYRANAHWTLFGRLERTSGAKNDAYLALLPEFVSTRDMAGARLEVARNQALKLELSRNERQDAVRFNQIGLQWSMVFP